MRYEFQKKKTGFVVCFYRSDGKAEIIINYIKEKGSITNKEARELLGLADSTIKRLLKGMVEQKLLIVEGERKARKYLLKNELEKQKK